MKYQIRNRLLVGFGLLGVVLGLIWLAPEPQQNYQDPFQISGRKVRLDFQELIPSSRWFHRGPFALSRSAYRASQVPAGSKLAMLVDYQCLEVQKLESNKQGQIGLESSVKLATNKSGVQTIRWDIDRAMTLRQIDDIVSNNPCILGVSHNRPARIAQAEDSLPQPAVTARMPRLDPMIERQMHFPSLHFVDVSHYIQREIVLAIIDTGIDLSHPDLRSNLWVNVEELHGQPGVDDDNNGFVDDIHGYNFPDESGDPSHRTVNDHGTHVAGLAAASASNGEGGRGVVGHKVKIMALNVFGRHWGTDTVDIDRAVRYAADNGANVINISVGGPGHSDTTASAIAYALSKGAVVVASAGNMSKDIDQDFYYPAGYASLYPGMLSVSAIEASTGQLCEFSNFARESVLIAAPGCDNQAPGQGLFSTRSEGRYGYKKGTSMATPLVSGAVVGILGVLPAHVALPKPSAVAGMLLGNSRVEPNLVGKVYEQKTLDLTKLFATKR